MLVVIFFQSLGWGQSAFPADAEDAAVKLMLSLLKDMGKEMTPRWQSAHLDRVINTIVEWLPNSKTLLTQVHMLLLADTMSLVEASPLHSPTCYDVAREQ